MGRGSPRPVINFAPPPAGPAQKMGEWAAGRPARLHPVAPLPPGGRFPAIVARWP